MRPWHLIKNKYHARAHTRMHTHAHILSSYTRHSSSTSTDNRRPTIQSFYPMTQGYPRLSLPEITGTSLAWKRLPRSITYFDYWQEHVVKTHSRLSINLASIISIILKYLYACYTHVFLLSRQVRSPTPGCWLITQPTLHNAPVITLYKIHTEHLSWNINWNHSSASVTRLQVRTKLIGPLNRNIAWQMSSHMFSLIFANKSKQFSYFTFASQYKDPISKISDSLMRPEGRNSYLKLKTEMLAFCFIAE